MATSIPAARRGDLTDEPARARHVGQVWALAGAVALFGLFTSNPLLTAASVLVLPLILFLTWRKGEPPVLFFACLVHWIQASAAVFHADIFGLTANETSWSGELEAAIWLSLIGLLALAAGMRLSLKGMKSAASEARLEIRECSPQLIFRLYIAAYGITTIVAPITFLIPQVTQIIVSLLNVKWVFIFLLAYVVLQRKSSYELLAVMLVLEIITGMVSYFSSFTRIFFVLLLVIPISGIRFTFRLRVVMVLIALTVVAFSIVWSAIKPDYRAFVNRGTGDQEVYVSASEALGKISELVSDFDAEAFERGTEALARRVAYVDFFAAAIDYVPAVMSYEYGSLWLGAFKHVLQPRLLFPDKPELDDSEQTRLYTGVSVAGASEGTSVSIGYFGESYIDFGAFGMMFPIFIVGLFWGLIYRLFVSTAELRVVGFAISTAILVVGAFNVGLSNVKLLGGNLLAVIVMLILRNYLLEPAARWAGITKPRVAG
jgi:hypothetical protein